MYGHNSVGIAVTSGFHVEEMLSKINTHRSPSPHSCFDQSYVFSSMSEKGVTSFLKFRQYHNMLGLALKLTLFYYPVGPQKTFEIFSITYNTKIDISLLTLKRLGGGARHPPELFIVRHLELKEKSFFKSFNFTNAKLNHLF